MSKCTPCMSKALKVDIAQKFDVGEQLAKIPDCSPGVIMDMCAAGAGGGASRRGRSAYQTFVSKCLTDRKGKPGPITEKMRECAVEWRKIRPQ